MSTFPSPAAGQFPFSTTVSELPLPVALERLFRARTTGILVLEARPGRHVVYVREGYPVSVELPGSFELLGKVLVEMKILDEATYHTTLASPPPVGTRYGELLLSRGLITEEQLRQALKAQVRRKLHRLYFLSDASISYTQGEHQEGLQRNESLRVHPWRANYHGVRSAWNADRLRQALAPLAGRSMSTVLTTEELARFGLGSEDGKAASLLRSSPHTVDALSAASGLPVQPVSALYYALYVAAALEDKDSKPAPTPASGTMPGFSTAAALATAPAASAVSAPAAPAAPAPPSELERLVTERAATIDAEDLFTVLGLPRTATADDVKSAYLEAARRFHPDRIVTQNLGRVRTEVEQIFRRISEAQSTLLDDTKRTQYREVLDNPASKEDAAAHQQALAILQAELAFKRGQHLLKKNDLVSALRDFEAALVTDPNDAEHVAYVAWTRRCLGQLNLADTHAEIARALKIQPNCASAHYFMGMVQKDEEAFEAALASFRKAVSLDARQFDAEQEIRVLEIRRAKSTEKKGLFDRFRKPGK